MVSKKTEELIKWDAEHIIHPYTPVGHNAGLVIEKGHGIWLVDTEGKEYIDMGAQLGYALLGYGRKDIAEAVQEQLLNLGATHNWFGWSNAKTIECAQKLAQVTPKGLDHFHFTSGGSESIDSAIKLARLYWYFQGKNKWKIICFYGAYHGFGGATWATSLGRGVTWEGVGPQMPGFVFVPSYYCYRCMFRLKYPDCNIQCARYLAEVIESEGVGTVAAFMAEPVMGAGGLIAPPPEYWPMVRKICDEYDVLLIGDEVQSGFVKTGKMFALQNWDVTPDIMTMAKAINNGFVPFGGVAVNDKVFQVLKDNTFWHGFTYSGHPVAAAASIVTLDVYLRDKVADNAAKVGKHIAQRLEAEFMPLPCVGGYTALGLMIGVEIVANKANKTPFPPEMRSNIQRQMWDKGVLARPISGYGGTRLFIGPPCIITIEEADKMLDAVLSVVATLKPS
jgi:adenosylmethionine-8-amino-7-oxononanoate aminotransferase